MGNRCNPRGVSTTCRAKFVLLIAPYVLARSEFPVGWDQRRRVTYNALRHGGWVVSIGVEDTVSNVMRGIFHVCLIAATAIAHAETYARFVQSIDLPDGRVAAVAEGDFEPRSIGSFSVRMYSAVTPDFPFDDFQAGIVSPREGAIEGLDARDIDHDGAHELIVTIRSAGTGGYLSAYAFTLASNTITVLAHVTGLQPTASVVDALETTVAEQTR